MSALPVINTSPSWMTPALAVVPPISNAIAQRLGADHACRRSGLEHADAGALRLLDAEQATGRLHDQKVAVEPGGGEMIADLAEIAAHARPDIGIRRRRRGALELAIFLRELVRGVAVGMQEQDGDRLYALPHRVGHGGAHLILVELDQHLAVRVHALADLVAQVALDQWLVAAKEEVVGFWPIDAADLVDIAEALRGEERARRSRPLQNGVDRNGRAVKKKARGRELRAGLR